MSFSGDWPAYSDDSGAGVDGTVLSKAFLDSIKTAISNQVLAAGNPHVLPNVITDEVVTARGNKASLAARLAGVIDVNGLFVATTDLSPVLGHQNLIANAELILWAGGDTQYPDGWGDATGAAHQRCGTGLADVNTKISDFSWRVTAPGGNNAGPNYRIASAFNSNVRALLRGGPLAFGAWVYATVANAARVGVKDGVGATQYSSYHTGDSTWQFLAVAHTGIDPAAVNIDFVLDVLATKVAYFDGFTGYYSSTAPKAYQPARIEKHIYTMYAPGVAAVGATKALCGPTRGVFVRRVSVSSAVAPTGASLIVNPKNNGVALFSAANRPKVLAAGQVGSAVFPDPVAYSTRSVVQGTALSFDIDQIGSGVAGSDVVLEVEAWAYADPFAALQPTTA